MADISMANKKKRNAGKSKPMPEAMPEEEANVIPGLTVEARDDRVHVWITPQFSILHDGSVYRGAAISLEGFEVEESAGLNADKRLSSYVLRLEIGSFVLEVPVKAVFEAETERNGRRTNLFSFRDVENGERDALRRFIRAHLSGHVVTVDDVIRKQDMPTNTRSSGRNGNSAQGDTSPNPVTRFVRRLFNLAITLGIVATIAFIGGFAVYERLTVVQSRFAAVTAPSLEMRAPASGQLTVSGPSSGEVVVRDQILVRIASPEQEADLIRARSAATARNTPLNRAELAAIELEIAANTTYAPCNCLVLWAPENGAWIQEGDRLYELARTDPEDMRVEALVSLREVDRLYRGQTAFINWPETDDLSEGVIEYIALDNIRQERAGFPNWLRQDQSMVSVMITVDTPVDPALIGHPVDVFVRTELPFWERLLRFVRSTASREE